MKLSELLDLLEDYVDDDPEVRIAQQPSWPLQSSVSAVVPLYDDDEDGEVAVVYIAEGSQCSGSGNDGPYVPGEVSEELGWR